MSLASLDPTDLTAVTGGRFLPRTRSGAYVLVFVAATAAAQVAADYLVKHDIGMLHVRHAATD